MSRTEQIAKLLKTLSTTTPDIEAAAVIDNDGLMIASVLLADVEDDRVASMSAALLGMSERIVRELGRGSFSLVMLRGTEGSAILTRSGPESVLMVLATETAKLGLVFLDITRAAKEIGRLLG